MTLIDRVIALAQGMGTSIKVLTDNQGNLSSLNTTAKTNLVDSINELVAATGQPQGAQIDDTATDGANTVVWSADKVYDSILEAKNALKDELIGGAGAAFDTLKELADLFDNNPNFATELSTALNNRVRFDDVQTLTAIQKTQACNNIGIGDPDTDFVAIYNAAKATTLQL